MHILCSITFSPKNHAVYEIMSKQNFCSLKFWGNLMAVGLGYLLVNLSVLVISVGNVQVI